VEPKQLSGLRGSVPWSENVCRGFAENFAERAGNAGLGTEMVKPEKALYLPRNRKNPRKKTTTQSLSIN
jgi:hypothetical protein